MGMFEELAKTIHMIEAEGFDPTKDTYGDKLKKLSDEGKITPTLSSLKSLSIGGEAANELKDRLFSTRDFVASSLTPLPVKGKPEGSDEFGDYYVIKDRFESGAGTRATIENLGKSSIGDRVDPNQFTKVTLVDGTQAYATKDKIPEIENMGGYAGVWQEYNALSDSGKVLYSDEIKGAVKQTQDISPSIKEEARQKFFKALHRNKDVLGAEPEDIIKRFSK
jgi:hypothetical protein